MDNAGGQTALISRWSLRFHSANQEQTFLCSRVEQLQLTTLRAHYIFGLFGAAALSITALDGTTRTLQNMGASPEMVVDAEAVRFNSILLGGFALALDLVIISLLWVTSFAPKHGELLEMVLVAELCFIQMMVPMSSRYYGAKLLSIDPVEFYSGLEGINPQFTDSGVLMAWCIFLVCGNLFMPIRWCSLIPLELVTIPIYAGCFALGSPENENVPKNLLILVFLCVLVAFGKRRMEISERMLFRQAIAERVQRYQSEFSMSQMSQAESAQTTLAVASDTFEDVEDVGLESVASVPVSHAVFNINGPIEVNLQAMEALGRHEGWLIDSNEIVMQPDTILGQGGFGVVAKGVFLGTPCAVKLPLSLDVESLRRLAHEARILRHIKHRNIVSFSGVCVVPSIKMFFLVEELVVGGTLGDLIEDARHGTLQLPQQLDILLGVIRALAYIHNLKPAIIHGDVKPQNVLIEHRSFQPKLADFGLSRIASEKRSIGGTTRWQAPEILFAKVTKEAASVDAASPLAPSTDIFSFGRLVFFTISGEKPLADLSEKQLKQSIEGGALPELSWPRKAIPWQNKAQMIYAMCCDQDPRRRATARKLVDTFEAAVRRGYASKSSASSSSCTLETTGSTTSSSECCDTETYSVGRTHKEDRLYSSVMQVLGKVVKRPQASKKHHKKEPNAKERVLFSL